MELGPQHHNGDGLSGPNSIIAVYMDPLGNSNAVARITGSNKENTHELGSLDERATTIW